MTKSNWKKIPLGADEKRLVGAMFDRRAAGLISLIALHRGMSKARLVRDCVSNNLPTDNTVIKTILHDVALRTYAQVMRQMSKQHRQHNADLFHRYRQQASKRLARRGLMQAHIDAIMLEVRKNYETYQREQAIKYSSKESAKTSAKV